MYFPARALLNCRFGCVAALLHMNLLSALIDSNITYRDLPDT